MASSDTKDSRRRKKVAKKKASQDRLEKAIRDKTKEITIDGRKLTLRKWSLRQGMKLGAKIASVIREAMPTGNVADIMHANVEQIVLDNEGNFIDVLVSSVERCFDGDGDGRRQAASDWVDDLALEDGLELFSEIARMNIRPLILKLGEMNKNLIPGLNQKDGSGKPEVSQPQTSSPS
ncbi:hypothetical protein LCGC14_0401640 [marine sediment metagenome]|uniref:Uncharacterized protein n=1 Tax=marine sediment metagenome TaxID=412755 RepID=A0A0F9VIM4_9ZZZZ